MTTRIFTAKIVTAFLGVFFISLFSFLFSPSSAHASIILEPTNYLRNSSLSQGLVGYWSFNNEDMNWATGKAFDRSGSGNDGVLTNMSTTTSPVAGKMGQALNFDGVNDSVSVASSTSLNTLNKTISFWINKSGSDSAAISFNDSTYIRFPSINQINITYTDSNNTIPLYASSFILPNKKWEFITITYSSNGTSNLITGYLNDSFVFATSSTAGFSSRPLVSIGARANASLFMNGSMDEVRYYNRVLSASEIRQLYLAGQVALQGTTGGSSRGCAISSLNCGLIGYWTFNNQDMNWATAKALDKSGSGNDATLSGGFATSSSPASGKVGQGLFFNGGSNFVSAPVGIVGTGPITYSAWVYAVSFGGFTQGSIIDNGQMRLRVNSNNSRFDFSSNNFGNLAFSANNAVVLKKWIHISVTRDASGTANIYVNGVLSGTANQNSGTPATSPNNTGIGNNGTGIVGFNGIIDDVRIYNRVLSAAEIKQLYLAGQVALQSTTGGSSRGCALSSLNCGLVGYWSFNNQDMNWATGKALDKSGNGNDGQLISMSTTSSPTSGKVGQALNFNGVSQYIPVTTNSGIPVYSTTTPYSISMWVKAPNTNDFEFLYSESNFTTSVPKFEFVKSNNANSTLRVGIQSDDGTLPVNNNSTTFVFDNKWHHIVWVDNSGNAKLYIDGKQDATDFTYTPRATTFNRSTIGGYVDGSTPTGGAIPFNGTLDDIRAYNRVLSATEIQQLYNMGR